MCQGISEGEKKEQNGRHETGPVVYAYDEWKRNKVLRCKANTIEECYFVNAVCGDSAGMGRSRVFHPIVWGPVVAPRVGELRKDGFPRRWWRNEGG